MMSCERNGGQENKELWYYLTRYEGTMILIYYDNITDRFCRVRVISVGIGSVTEPEGNLCRVPDLLQNSQKCRLLWCNCHRNHRSIGYCGAAVTDLTEVYGIVVLRSQNSPWGSLCRVTTDGNYPRTRASLCTCTLLCLGFDSVL